MNRVQKTLLLLLLIVASLPILFLLLVTRPTTMPHSFLDRLQFTLVSHELFVAVMFWIAVAVAVILLLAMLFIIFYPRTRARFVIKQQNGTLAIKNKAIKGLVETNIAEKDFVSQPTVDVNATKKKIKVRIKGDLKRTSSLVQKTNAWTEEIRRQIQQLMGSGYNIVVDVKFKNVEKESKNTDTARVE